VAFQALRHRFLWRQRAPLSPGEIRRTERWLATARVFLAISALVAVLIDPREIHYSPWVSGLFAFYIAQAVGIMLLLRRRQESSASFRWLVHAGDIVLPALISVFATSQSNPFFLLFVFVMAAAAYRWGVWETTGTAVAAVSLLWIESLGFQSGLFAAVDRLLLHHKLAVLQFAPAEFEPRRLFVRSVYLLVMGLLLGYLAEQQKQLRAERAVITRIQGKASVEAGLSGTLQNMIGELVGMYGAGQALLASQESNSHRVFVGQMRPAGKSGSTFRWLDPLPSDREVYLSQQTAETAYVLRSAGHDAENFSFIGLDKNGSRISGTAPPFVERLSQYHEFQNLITVSFLFGSEWWGRIFLLDTSLTGDIQEELRFLQELVQQVGPAVYNVYLLRRLRLRASAVERARVARELHDGAVQSLIAMEMQVDVLRRTAGKSSPITDELGRIQGLLREEVLKLRELMQQMKSLDVDSRRLLGFLADTVERFQRETGISARFLSELDEIDMPQQVCREVARIVQEGLVNVRKHSRARQVLVRFGAKNQHWTLVMEDDGCGFPFAGRLSHLELDALGRGPLVIKERVRLIDGELTIESIPGQGARLEISVPQKREAAYGY
jgi:signal transduction histidine kinase